MKSNELKELIEDIAMFLMIVCVFAFKDYKLIVNIFTLVAFVIVLLCTIKRKKIDKKMLPYLICKLLFIFVCLLSYLWALNKEVVISIFLRVLHRFMMGITVVFYVNNKERLNKIIKFMIISCIILCIRMIVVVPHSAWGHERVGNYLSHDIEASYGNTSITYMLGIVGVYVLTSNKELLKNKYVKYFLVFIFSLLSLLTGSKKQVIFLIVSIPLLILLNTKSSKELLKNILIGMVAICITMFLIFKIDLLYNAIGVRVLQTLSYFFNGISIDTDPSTLSRINFIKDSWNVFLNNPLFGIGIGGYQYVNSTEFVWAENNFLELLADTGFIGLLSYYSLYILIIIALLRKKNKRSQSNIQIIIVLVCLFIIDLSMVSYYFQVLQFYLALVYAAVILPEEGCYE